MDVKKKPGAIGRQHLFLQSVFSKNLLCIVFYVFQIYKMVEHNQMRIHSTFRVTLHCTAMNTLPLKSVVIGCADLSSYHRLTHAICGTLLPTPTTPNTSPAPNQQHEVINASQLSDSVERHSNAGRSCDRGSLSSEQHHTPIQLFMLGGLLSNDSKQNLVLEYDHSVPQEFLDSCRVKACVSDYTVVSTTPFAKGMSIAILKKQMFKY